MSHTRIGRETLIFQHTPYTFFTRTDMNTSRLFTVTGVRRTPSFTQHRASSLHQTV